MVYILGFLCVYFNPQLVKLGADPELTECEDCWKYGNSDIMIVQQPVISSESNTE